MADRVFPNKDMHGNSEMNLIGWVMAIVLLVIVVPLLPFIVLLYLFSQLVDRTRRPERDAQSSIR